MADKPFRDMSDDELQAEWQKWDSAVSNATGWGAAVAAANSFRKEAAREIQRRCAARMTAVNHN